MKKFCKIICFFIVGLFLAMTTPVCNPVNTVKAADLDFDEDLIEWVLEHDLAKIVFDYWMGREYGSDGEEQAAEYLIASWDDNISEGNFLDADWEYITSRKDGDYIDEKDGILNYNDYSLEIDGVGEDPESCYPLIGYNALHPPELYSGKEYEVIEPPGKFYGSSLDDIKDNELSMMELEAELIKENILDEIKFVSLNDGYGIWGGVTYIEDYEDASINDTEGRIHLIEIKQSENDDVFEEKINAVNNSNASAFIAMVSNPSFINTLNTSIPGIAISRFDGEKIKQSLDNNETIYVEPYGGTSSSDGTLKVYHIEEPACQTDKIYLFDMDKYKEYDFDPRYPAGLVGLAYFKSLIKPCDKYPTLNVFLYRDLSENGEEGEINKDTHIMSPICWPFFKGYFPGIADLRDKFPKIGAISPKPGFCIRGGHDVEVGDSAVLKIKPTYDETVESRNIICKYDNPTSDNVLIVCAHYDYYWGQGAIDDAAGVAAMFGIAKYIKDNDISPNCDIKFIAFAGEEYTCRGSNYYVSENVIGGENVIAVINLDVLAVDNTAIPLQPYIKSNTDLGNDDPKIKDIRHIFKLYNKFPENPYKLKNPILDYGGATDAKSFRNFDGKVLADYIVDIGRIKEGDWDDMSYFDHRSGADHTKGDTIDKIDYDDLYNIAEIALRLIGYFAGFDDDLDFNNDCSFTQLDCDSDGQYDSVKIGFAVNSNITSGGKVESRILLNGQPQTSNISTDLLSIDENETVYGNLTVTLPYNGTAGNCDIQVYLKNYQGDVEDFDNTTYYLYPYNHSIANYTWEVNDDNLKMVNFTDCSTPSPNAVISSWNWSFGDGNYSMLQNCSHNYSSVGFFNVTLTVTDSVNKSANITKQVETSNTLPVPLFDVSSRLVLVNKSVSFNSTSYDVDGSIVNAKWFFGDNTTGYGINTTHSYNKSGFYMVSLYATDNDNSSVRLTKTEHILVVDALVDDGFTDDPVNHSWNSIQEGINDVADDEFIYVYNGSYTPILVNRSVSIYGENKNGVHISSLGIGIDIQSHDILIKNFTIFGGTTGVKIFSTVNGTGNVTIDNVVIPGPITYGVLIDNSTNNTIKNCKIEKAEAGIKICNGGMYNVIDNCDINECYNGVGIYSSNYNWVGDPSIYDWHPNDCTFKLNTNAVYLDESDHNYILGCNIDADSPLPFGTYRGIYLDESDYTTISTCDIYKGTQGVYIKDSKDSKIEFCRIKENQMGLEFYGLDAKNNLIVQNNITINTQFGIYIPAEPSNNSIYYNDFIGNMNPGVVNQSHDDRSTGLMNIWEKTGNNTLTKNGNGEGNYWDDYSGSDLDLDGIGDTPYELDTSTRGIKDDSYPLMVAYGWCTGTGWD